MMKLSMGLGLAGTGGSAEAPPITGTGPTLGALDDGDTLSSAVTWGSYSSTGGSVSTTKEMRVDGGSWTAYDGNTVVQEGEVWQIRETVEDEVENSRVFTSAVQPVAFGAVTASGTVTAQDWQPDEAVTPLDMASYFSGTVTGYAVQAGSLPAGVSLDTLTGEISGTPTSEADGSVTIRASNPDHHADQSFDWTVVEPVAPPVAAGGISAQGWTVGVAITSLDVAGDFTGSGITYDLAPSSDPLPDGVSLSGAGMITGTPTETAADLAIVVRGTNSAGYDDTGFEVDVEAAPTAPAAFEVGDWSLTAGDEEATLTVSALPDDGGSAITALQYRLDGGSAVTMSGTGTGARTISSLTNETEYDVEIRAVNAVGAGSWSDVKSVTPEAEGDPTPYAVLASYGGSPTITTDIDLGDGVLADNYCWAAAGSITVSQAGYAEYFLCDAGGPGGGGAFTSGGGGGGADALPRDGSIGMIWLDADDYTIEVAAAVAGPSGTGVASANTTRTRLIRDSDSEVILETALGNGGRGGVRMTFDPGTDSALACTGGQYNAQTGNSAAGQVHSGGSAVSSVWQSAAGGAGLGGNGGNAQSDGLGGVGGAGISNSISGTAKDYCGGGGGGSYSSVAATGSGGGGNGGKSGTPAGTNATRPGAGGGGGSASAGAALNKGGKGGDGEMNLRFRQ